MEALMLMILPLALLGVGFALITGRSLAPATVIRSIISFLWRLLRWLWQARRQRQGRGKVKPPRSRYYNTP